jgi:hypothetical protein
MVALHCYEIGPDTVIARDPEDVRVVLVECYGDDALGDYKDDEPRELPEGKMLGVRDDDGVVTRKPVSEWIAENGRGLLCSTEF